MDSSDAASIENGGGSHMIPLEIEEETMSLFHETNGRATVLRKRQPKSSPSVFGSLDVMSGETGFRGLLRSKTAFAIRNACLLATLAWMVFLFVDAMDKNIEGLAMDDENPRGIHQSSFGGKNNPASIAGQRAHAMHEEDELHDLDRIPALNNVGQKIPSISVANSINHIGHYWHDPFNSVFSSVLYDEVTQEELNVAQLDFQKKVNKTKNKFGFWNLVDPYFDENLEHRPRPEFTACPNRDCNMSDFPADAWQLDTVYVNNFLTEAKKLIARVKEGIYEEYGHSSYDKKGKLKPEEQREERSKIFQVLMTDQTNSDFVAVDQDSDQPQLGVAHLSPKAWDGLVRKLLHALMTNNNFFVVVAGDGTAAGHGNNFLQSPVMQFHYLLEPVMDFLGISLISRNMATKDASVVHEAMGGGDIYGEIDLLWYDSHWESPGAKDLLYKQAILSGERVPVILTSDPVQLEKETNAWIGNLQPNTEMCGGSTKGVCDLESHNSVCWVPRVFITPPVEQDADIDPEAYPGVNAHQLQARKLSMLVLHALDDALDMWLQGVETDGFPLADSYWHVGPTYNAIRESVRTLNKDKSACETMMGELAMVCHVEMHGYTEWTPRVTPYTNSLKAILPKVMDVYDAVEEYYEEIDLFPRAWDKGDAVDPHLIAIATSAPPPDDNDDADEYYLYDDDYGFYYTDDAMPSGDESPGDDTNRVRSFRQLEKSVTSPAPRELSDAAAEQPTALEPGKGWGMYGKPAGFCDGSAQSTCGRSRESSCLMAGHNDYTRAGILGDALSGWLLMSVQHIKEGVVLARLDFKNVPEKNPVTEGWTQINDKATAGDDKNNNDDAQRQLIPKDFSFDYSVNGKVTSLTKTDFENLGVTIGNNEMTLYPLFVDPSPHDEEERMVEIGIRVRSKQGRRVRVMLTHLYYA